MSYAIVIKEIAIDTSWVSDDTYLCDIIQEVYGIIIDV